MRWAFSGEWRHAGQCWCFACAKLVQPEANSTPRSGKDIVPLVPGKVHLPKRARQPYDLKYRNWLLAGLNGTLWFEIRRPLVEIHTDWPKGRPSFSWASHFIFTIWFTTRKAERKKHRRCVLDPGLRKSDVWHQLCHPQ